MNPPFTHLHLASGYSFKYGTTLPAKIVERAHELEMQAIALTDRETLAGAIRFVGSCVEHSINPIIGVDLPSDENARITLLATPGRGWNSLVRLVTAWKESAAPLSLQFLHEHSNLTSHLLALHGPDSHIGRSIVARRYEKALAIFNQSRDLIIDHRTPGIGLRAGDRLGKTQKTRVINRHFSILYAAICVHEAACESSTVCQLELWESFTFCQLATWLSLIMPHTNTFPT